MVSLGDMHFNEIHHYPLFFICPLTIGWTCFWILGKTENLFCTSIIRLFSWIAHNGIVVLACHIYIIILFDKIWERLGVKIPGICFIAKFLFVSLTLRFLVVPFINNYCHMFIGRHKI